MQVIALHLDNNSQMRRKTEGKTSNAEFQVWFIQAVILIDSRETNYTDKVRGWSFEWECWV